MHIKTFLISAILASAGVNAMAASTDWGVLGLDGADVRASSSATGAVDDIYSFSLGNDSDVISTSNYYTATSLKGVKTVDLANATLSLYSGLYGDGVTDVKVDSIAFGTSMTDYTFAALGAGSYYFEVTGTAGTKGSDYYFNVEAIPSAPPLSAIPEPQNAALLFAGLAALGLMAKRRQGGRSDAR